MAYGIYEDKLTSRAVIHNEDCERYIDLKNVASPDSQRHEGYESVDAASRRAPRLGSRYVGECGYCPQQVWLAAAATSNSLTLSAVAPGISL